MKRTIISLLMLSVCTSVFCQDNAPRADTAPATCHMDVVPLKEVTQSRFFNQELTEWTSHMEEAWHRGHPVVRSHMTTDQGQFYSPANYREAQILDRKIQADIKAQILISKEIPRRDTLISRLDHIMQEFGEGHHQLMNVGPQQGEALAQMRVKFNNFCAHAEQNALDAQIDQLCQYLTVSAPGEQPKEEINALFLASIEQFNQSLQRLTEIVAGTSEGIFSNKQRIILDTLKTEIIPEISARIQAMHRHLPGSVTAQDYDSLRRYLTATSETDHGLAFRPRSQNGRPGLTFLETFIGGFMVGSDHVMYSQFPNLFNFIIQFQLTEDLLRELINIRKDFCNTYRLITPDPQAVLSNEAVIAMIIEGNKGRLQLLQQLLNQMQTVNSGPGYKEIKENITLWQAHQQYEQLTRYQSAQDFLVFNQAQEQKANEVENIRQLLLRKAENFLSRDRKLINVVGLIREISGINSSLDRLIALEFEQSLVAALNERTSHSREEDLMRTFTPYFRDNAAAESFIETIIRYHALREEIEAIRNQSELIKRISIALKKHYAFVDILSEIVSIKDTLTFKDESSKTGKQTTRVFFEQIINSYKTASYLVLAPSQRSDQYRHTLAALQDSNLWEEDPERACNLFQRAHEAYIAARDAIKAINLPRSNGPSRILPGFDMREQHQETSASAHEVPFTPPPPPPNNLHTRDPWPSFKESVRRYIATSPHHQGAILDYLRSVINDAQSYIDYNLPTAQDLRSELNRRNIKI
ncbi:hypothetical protein [Candidatus Odyssella thessalonicensis]|uniref:hypothetical protein n=1 Tax=Candidatus Odyssella thessalonicensis TaxID=84647 RepID=UPI000225B905|nr:hypothetical protein [Candidatus Odyssella thessalonicensis]